MNEDIRNFLVNEVAREMMADVLCELMTQPCGAIVRATMGRYVLRAADEASEEAGKALETSSREKKYADRIVIAANSDGRDTLTDDEATAYIAHIDKSDAEYKKYLSRSERAAKLYTGFRILAENGREA